MEQTVVLKTALKPIPVALFPRSADSTIRHLLELGELKHFGSRYDCWLRFDLWIVQTTELGRRRVLNI